MRTQTSHLARRHPFVFGTVMIVFGPYILAFLLLLAALFAAAALIDWLGERK